MVERIGVPDAATVAKARKMVVAIDAQLAENEALSAELREVRAELSRLLATSDRLRAMSRALGAAEGRRNAQR